MPSLPITHSRAVNSLNLTLVFYDCFFVNQLLSDSLRQLPRPLATESRAAQVRWSFYDNAVLQVQARRRNLRRTATTTIAKRLVTAHERPAFSPVPSRRGLRCTTANTARPAVGERGGCTIRTANDNAQLQR